MIFTKVVLVYIAYFIYGVQSEVKANTKSCITAARRIANRGDGTTPNSCMSCDPTFGTCPDGCQSRIDTMYLACDDVCLPDGYFFDPPKLLNGCWKDNLFDTKIAVERCGCDSGSRVTGSLTLLVGMGIFLCLLHMVN